MTHSQYHQVIRALSDRIVNAQKPIRILDALKWSPDIKADFFANHFKKMPKITKEFYEQNPLHFEVSEKITEFTELEHDIRVELGQYDKVGIIMRNNCHEYIKVVEMLAARGTPAFTTFSQELYGSSKDEFYAGAPTLEDLALILSNTLNLLKRDYINPDDIKRYSSEQTVELLKTRLKKYFGDREEQLRVVLSDNIIADAAAGAEVIKIRNGATFSKRDLKVLEVHEGWVHLGTTLNGLRQPYCTFLSKGPPSATVTQEGLAIITEIFTFSSHPGRMQGLSDRIVAISMAEDGANFIEVFNYFREQGFQDEDAYSRTTRVFRGSLPEAGPFTKDLVYNKGFILIYNYIRLAIQKGLLSYIPLLFLGKTTLDDLHLWHDLVQEGLVLAPKYMPPQFKDLTGLSSWMCYSLFLNQLDLKHLAKEYKNIL